MTAQSAARNSTRFMAYLLLSWPVLRRLGQSIVAALVGLARALRARRAAAWHSHAGGEGVFLRRPNARKCASVPPATSPVSAPSSSKLRPDPGAPDVSLPRPLPGQLGLAETSAELAPGRWPRPLPPLRLPHSTPERLR